MLSAMAGNYMSFVATFVDQASSANLRPCQQGERLAMSAAFVAAVAFARP